VREFLYEAFLIPTASMEPTILGKEERVGRNHGDRLLATKIPVLASDLPRWSIVVFKYPLYRRINYIKRLVGLPGERVELRGGDVYVNGECVAKPESVQDTLWFAEYPSPGQERPLSVSFQPQPGHDGWELGAASAQASAPAGEETWLDYDERLSERDHDLAVGADIDVARLEDGGAILLRVEGERRRVDLAIGAESAVLNAPGLDGEVIEGVHVGAGKRVTLGVADRVVRIWVDGKLVARVPHADAENDGPRASNVALGVRGATASFGAVRVARDLQYQKSRGWDIPDDGFIMLGDNTASSKDSREWRVNVVTAADGTVYEGESDVKLEDNSTVRFTNDGTNYRFIDVDGVFRVVPMEGATVDHGAPRPYVRRRDLVGRAFVVFFPFPPFGDFQPRFLP
jgi:signal peptidase I